MNAEVVKKTDKPYFENSSMPYPVIMHFMASASCVAYVMYQEYVNALPLKRQETDWKNLGINLRACHLRYERAICKRLH